MGDFEYKSKKNNRTENNLYRFHMDFWNSGKAA